MNKDKVYLKGYVIGRAADTLGYEGLMVQLENLDVVEIDKNLVHRDINESQKVTVPQFVADYIDISKFYVRTLHYALENSPEKVKLWLCEDEKNRQEIFARAWLDGYTVGKEPKYTVKIKGKIGENLLVYGWGIKRYFFARTYNDSSKRGEHTRKQLEEAGFGWVFDCEGIEIEEVEE